MTRKINISGIIFNVEPVGYEILRAYLEAWEQMNSKGKEKWEEQVAEYLLQKLNSTSTITTTAHVQGMNKILSEVPFPSSQYKPIKRNWSHYLNQVAFGLW